MLYLVRWEIDIEADSPQEAAEKARAIQTRPGTTATVFDVLVVRGPPQSWERSARIDLSEPEDSTWVTATIVPGMDYRR